uniref:Toll-like receptor 4b, duplicate b n=1 Tax=Sinocyclocheilus grahami TaxID=75366 RepID=A0A672KPP6_SINGR
DIFLTVTVDLLFTLGPVDYFSVKVLSSQLHVYYVVGDCVIMVTGDLVITFKDFSLHDLHANNISIIKTDHTAVLRDIGRNMNVNLSWNPLLYIEPGAFKDIYLRELNIRSTFVSSAAQQAGLKALCGLNVKRLKFGKAQGQFQISLSDTDFLDGLEPISVFCCVINATNVLARYRGWVNLPTGSSYPTLPYVCFREIKELYLIIWIFCSNQIRLKQCCTSLFGTPQIRYLNLSSNAEIGLDLGGLEGLEILDFHNTTVVRVGYLSVLSNLKYLRYLDVSYSSTTFTNIFSFYGVTSKLIQKSSEGLRLLNLRGNHLMTIHFLAYPDLKQLTSLYDDKNSITSIPLNVLQKLLTNLSDFNLSSNPIDCSCSQTDFIWWIIHNQNVLEQPENIFCKTFSPSSDFRATDVDIDSCVCVHKKRLTIVLSVCFVTVVVLLSFLVYRFQFYLQYCCILLRGYRSPGQPECSYDAFVIFSSYDEVWVMNELMENLENSVPPIQLCLHMRDFQAGKSIILDTPQESYYCHKPMILHVYLLHKCFK